MNTCSYFVKDKALFGSYPTQEKIEILERIGVRYFVDLTYPKEPNITSYTTRYTYINYPIHDKKVPKCWGSFASFIRKISNIITNLDGEQLYIHCRGGHGRSGVVVASLLCYIHGYSPDESLHLTGFYHNQRPEMRDKWRRLGSPQNRLQQEFVKSFFRPLYFYMTNRHSLILGLSNYSQHSVTVEGLGTFPTVEAAYQAHKDPNNKEYVTRQSLAHTPAISKILGKKCKNPPDWEEKRSDILKKLIKLKFDQHLRIQHNLSNTGLRPIIKQVYFYSNRDIGCGTNTKIERDNSIGEFLMKIREEYQDNIVSNPVYQSPLQLDEEDYSLET